MSKITILIDKRDNIEILRDEVAAILAIEIANQKVLAVAAGKDPDDFDFDIYIERSSPWELIEDEDGKIIRQVPLVNVYLEGTTFDGTKMSSINQMAYSGNIIIDCLSAKTHKIVGGIKKVSDELASKDVQRVARLVRNILMSAVYFKLNMPTVLNDRYVQSIAMFQPTIGERPAQACIGARVTLAVNINEFVPQADMELLELVQGTIERGDDGIVYANVTFDESDT